MDRVLLVPPNATLGLSSSHAARRGNRRLVAWLLDRGADPDHSLWSAAFGSDVELFQPLLEHVTAIDAVTEVETPLRSLEHTFEVLARFERCLWGRIEPCQ